MASFLDRIRSDSDYADDGGYINQDEFRGWMAMYASGVVTAAQIKSYYSCTTAQSAQLDAIFATRPSSPLLLLNVPAYVQWADKVVGIIQAACGYWTGFTTDALVKAALGI